MTAISLTKAVDAQLLRSFQGVAQSNTRSNPLRGGSNVSISDGLRQGARTYASAIQGLNATISFMQVGRATLERLDKLTDKLITLADEAARPGSGEQQRREYDLRFKRLGKEFREIIDESEVNGNNIITTDGIKGILVNIGLDPEKSESIASFFDDFVTVADDVALASEQAKGNRPANIPPSAYRENQARLTKEYDSIFAADRSITNRPDAYLMVEDLKGLKRQIAKNADVLEEGIDVIAQNIQLVRATGLALLEVEGQITGSEDAEEVARRVRELIRREAGPALSQAENLEPIAVAALTFNSRS